MISPASRILTSIEAAAYLKITDSTIRAQIRKRKLKGDKRGGIWLFTLKEVERYARENQTRRKGGRRKEHTPG